MDKIKKVRIEKIIKNAQEILERQVKKSSNGAVVYIPRQYIGKKVTIVIHKGKD